MSHLVDGPKDAPEKIELDPVLEIIKQSRQPVLTVEELRNEENCYVMGHRGNSFVVKAKSNSLMIYDENCVRDSSTDTSVTPRRPLVWVDQYISGKNFLVFSSDIDNQKYGYTAEINTSDDKLNAKDLSWENYTSEFPNICCRKRAGKCAIVVTANKILFKSGNIVVHSDDIGLQSIKDNLVVDDKSNSEEVKVFHLPNKEPKAITVTTIYYEKGKPMFEEKDIPLETTYPELYNLRLLQPANILMAQCAGHVVFINPKTGQEIYRIANIYHVHTGPNQEEIRGFNHEGKLTRYKLHIGLIEGMKDAQDSARALSTIKVQAAVVAGRDQVRQNLAKRMDALLDGKRAEVKTLFSEEISRAATIDAANAVEVAIARSKVDFASNGVAQIDVDKIFEEVESLLFKKKRELVGHEIDIALEGLNGLVDRGLTLNTLGAAHVELGRIRAQSSFLRPEQVAKLTALSDAIDEGSAEIYRREKETIASDLMRIQDKIDAKLTSINGNKTLFDRWYGGEWPEEQRQLRALLLACPAGASEAYDLIRRASAANEAKVSAARVRFEEQYEAVREVAIKRQDEMAGLIETDIDRFIELLDKQQFGDSAQAQAWVTGQGLYTLIMESIRGLSAKDNLRSTELEHNLLSRVSSALDRKKRMEHTTVTDEGARTVQLGDESFPVWERATSAKDRPNININLVFQPEPGQGTVKPADRLGKVMLNATMANVTMGTVDLWRDMGADADTIRLGLASYRGKDIPPSVMTGTQYKDFQKKAADWNKGTVSPLRKTYKDLRAKLRDTYKSRNTDANWRETYKQLLEEYADFCTKNHIVLLRQMEKVSKQLEAGEAAQSIGAVPKWAAHWVMDGETEKMLGQLAGASKMELALQEGVVNLKGHAGTGKDVLVKMLCHLSNRPYFAFDCTKWTTEYELAEDVQLVAVDGVTTTVRVPSSVLLALQTPGAVLYFNEFNAMPEQSQIYLHALFDEKRTMTIKTRSGASIKADPTVLFISSMNPGYEGTYEPQLATKSRTIPIEVGYPALMNPDGKTYSSSEAWRIARGVDSLFRLTLQGDATDNVFVRAWDAEVNRRSHSNTPTLTPGQLFDLKVVTALVQFGDKLRAAFISTYERGSRSGGAKAMKINQPLTGREMRRFAYRINQISPDKKVSLDPEQVAKDLIKSLFLVHIDSLADRIEAQKAVDQMTVSKAA
jgi:hypothetical protein